MTQMIPPDAIDPTDLVTIWQSELAALAVDREWHERLLTMCQGLGQSGAVSVDHPPRRAGADAPPGAAPADAAHDLWRQLDDLRERLAGLSQATIPPP